MSLFEFRNWRMAGAAIAVVAGTALGPVFPVVGQSPELRLGDQQLPEKRKTRCYRNLFCFHLAVSKRGVDYWFEALTHQPLTFSLRATNDNMRGPVRTGAVLLDRPGLIHMARLRQAVRGKWKYNFKYSYHPGRPDTAKPDPKAVYELPFAPGRGFKVTQGFNSSHTHKKMEAFAVDWNLPSGTPVHAAREGVVAAADGASSSAKRGRGNFIWIRHPDGTYGWYLHLKPGGVLVKAGQRVVAGQHIGYSGNTGKTSGPHLHFQVSVPTSGRYAFRTIPFRLRTADGIVGQIKTGDRHRRPR